MSKLKELEKRLKQEPTNLGLRVMAAGAMREAGRSSEAVELYRSVALAYRDQGRLQQAIAVCRSILEIVPDDVACQGLMQTLMDRLAPARTPTPVLTQPARRSSMEETPLPKPVPYHVHDPTSSAQKILREDLDSQKDLPSVEDAKTKPGDEITEAPRNVTSGLSAAARAISGLISENVMLVEDDDVAESLDTRKVRKIETDQLRKLPLPPKTGEVERLDVHDMATPAPVDIEIETDKEDALTPVPMRELEDEMTEPRELPRGRTIPPVNKPRK